jgi:hypothetical protein
MIAFELHINGKKVATAGVEQGVMSVIANWVRLKQDGDTWQSSVSIAGLDDKTSEHLKWFRQDLVVGDEIQILLVDSERIDIPVEREMK